MQRAGGAISIFNAAEQLLLETLSKVAAEMHIPMGSPAGNLAEDVTDYIAAQRPHTMIWSNVLDYLFPTDFHKVARACCTKGGTVHFGSSMNWVCNTRGACLLDYPVREARVQVLEKTTAWIREEYERAGMQYLRWPPPENPLNNVAVLLEPMFFPAWADHWFGVARRGGQTCRVAEHTGFAGGTFRSPLTSQGSSSVHLAWTYDA